MLVGVAYTFRVERSGCLNCGVCMDVCPVRALDMTRRTGTSIESRAVQGSPSASAGGQDWMMEFPIQTGECVGCELCAAECPTNVITITADAGRTALAPPQGPISTAPETAGWAPLSAYTREARSEPRSDPWDALAEGRPADRAIAPCQEACPVGTDAGLYVGLVGEGRYAEAFAVAAEHNPFPSICGRVCTAPCEVACRRGVLDQPIAIRELKRFATDHGAAGYPPPVPAGRRRAERVAIVGSGPTGLSAAHALIRSGYGVTIFEAMPVAGGMMAVGIPEYRLPKDVLRADVDRIVGLGVELRLNTALGRDISLEQLKADGYDAILLATGASKSQRLGIAGEEAEGVWPATLFLKKVNLGERVRLTGDVLVVGGGSTAMDAARTAWRAGARSVRVLYRRTRADLPAQQEERRAAEHEGVIIEPLVAPVEVLRKNGLMTGVRCVRLAISGRDADGRSAVAPIPGSEFVIDASALMVAVGEAPDPSILPDGSNIQIAEWGGVVVDAESLATAQPGIFAAGDVATGPRSVIEGAAQGQRAAWAIDRYLRHEDEGTYAPSWRDRPSRARTTTVSVDVTRRPRAETALAAVRATPASYAEVSLGLTEADARAEATRCFRCDVIARCPSVQIQGRRSA